MAFTDVLFAAFLAAAATSLGALMVLPFKKAGCNLFPLLLSFSAGMMAYSAAEMLNQSHQTAGDLAVAIGFTLGMVALVVSEKLLPHIHLLVRKKKLTSEKKKVALVVGTVTLHNVPEGFAIASAFAGSTPLGWLVATAIAIQDFPEGFLVSGPLSCYGMEGKRSVQYGILSGIVEFGAAVMGFLLLSFISALTPFALSFAAGAMAYLIFAELLPDAFKKGFERGAAIAFILGIALTYTLASVMGF